MVVYVENVTVVQFNLSRCRWKIKCVYCVFGNNSILHFRMIVILRLALILLVIDAMESFNQSCLKLPKLVAFDLDGTIWSPDMYELWGGGAQNMIWSANLYSLLI